MSVSPPLRPREDNLPLWVIVLLIFFAGLQVFRVAEPLLGARVARHLAPSADSGLTSDSMQDLVQADVQAKGAFAATLGQPGAVVTPDPKALQEALTDAERLERESRNMPGAARRVILLRALLNKPPLAPQKNGMVPLDAFGRALPAELQSTDRTQLGDEGRLWKSLFGGPPLSPNQAAAASRQIRALPNVRWWKYPALMALSKTQGDLSEANRYADEARTQALPALTGTAILALLCGVLMLLGLILLIWLLVAAARRERGPSASETAAKTDSLAAEASFAPAARTGEEANAAQWPPPLPVPEGAARVAARTEFARSVPAFELWPTLPSPLAPDQRRLGAGDLMGVFVVYLLTREVLSLLLSGFPGFGHAHWLHFHGLLWPWRQTLENMTAAQRSAANIILEAAFYVVSAVPPVVYLLLLARRRGASLADEIGWNRRHFGANLVYGVGGLAIASPLMIIVALLGKQALKHAPDPSNPAIPMLAGSSGFWIPLVLVLLATVAAPLLEELFFRGVFYNAARLRLGVWPAIILTGLVFGFIHPVGIVEMLAIAVLGGVFAWMAETRKSLLPGIVAHCLQNLTTTLLLLFALAG